MSYQTSNVGNRMVVGGKGSKGAKALWGWSRSGSRDIKVKFKILYVVKDYRLQAGST